MSLRFYRQTAAAATNSGGGTAPATLSVGAIAGIAIAGAIVLFIGLAPLLVWLARLQDRRRGRTEDVHVVDLGPEVVVKGPVLRPKTSIGPGTSQNDEKGESDGSSEPSLGDRGRGAGRNKRLSQQKRLRKKTSSNASETSFSVDGEKSGYHHNAGQRTNDHQTDPSAVTPFLARPYESAIQYEQRPLYEDERQDDTVSNLVRLSNKSHTRSWTAEDGYTNGSNRNSAVALINFAGYTEPDPESDKNKPAAAAPSSTNNHDASANNTSTTRSWFPQTLGKSLSRKLSFNSRSVEEIIGNPRILNSTGRKANDGNGRRSGAGADGNREEISVHDTPRSTPVIVHGGIDGGEDYMQSWQAGANGHPANAPPVIPRAPASVIHNPRQRLAAAADATHKQQLLQQQQKKKQLQLAQQQQQQMMLLHQQQQMQFMNQQQQHLQASPPKRPPRFRQSATDSELTEILRMTAERLEDRSRSERRQLVVNSAADVAGSENLMNSRGRSQSPTKAGVVNSNKSSARETMLSSDTTGENINLIIPAAASTATATAQSSNNSNRASLGPPATSSSSSQNTPQHRRRISHVSFASMISEPDSLVAGDNNSSSNNGNRPLSQHEAFLASHHTPLSSPSRTKAQQAAEQQQQQRQSQAGEQQQNKQQHSVVGGSHRPFSPASTESSALSTLYSEDEPGSAGGASPSYNGRRQQRNSRNSVISIPSGLYRTDSQRKALAEVLRRSRDFDAENSIDRDSDNNSNNDPSMSPAPLRLRSSTLGGMAAAVGETDNYEYSPSMRDFQMIDTQTRTIRSIVDGGEGGGSNRSSARHSANSYSAAKYGGDSAQTPRATIEAAGDDDPFVSATPQHNARLSQLFSPLPKDGPRPTAMNAAHAAIKGRYSSGGSVTPISNTKNTHGLDSSSAMGRGEDDSEIASPSRRLTVYLTKATPEAETPTPMTQNLIRTPQRRVQQLQGLDGSPSLGPTSMMDPHAYDTPGAYSETRLSSLYDSYQYSDRSDYGSYAAHQSTTTLATTPTTTGNTSTTDFTLRGTGGARYGREMADMLMDGDRSDGGGTDSDATVERLVEDVLLPSRGEVHRHDESSKTASASSGDRYSKESRSSRGSKDLDGGDTLGRLSTFEGDVKKMSSMRVTQAIAELRRMNSQVSSASGHTVSSASDTGTVLLAGDDVDSPTLPQLRGGGFSPSKRSSSILGRRNYLALGSTASHNSDRTSYAVVDGGSSTMAEEGEHGGMFADKKNSSPRRSRAQRRSPERRAEWRRTMANPSTAASARTEPWTVDEKSSETEEFLSRQSLAEALVRRSGEI